MQIVFRYLLFKIPALLILVGCVVYFARTRSAEGLLALVGQAVGVVSSAVLACLLSNLADQKISAGVFQWVRIGQFVGGIMFAVAFLKIVADRGREKVSATQGVGAAG